jgi:heat-inducible transcriptional repressor
MLTERQIQLLQAIINEYISSSEPVGSVELVTRYNLKFSPATVRNEMAHLIDQGFLEMLHSSSGRVPTRMAYRLYLDQLMNEIEIPVLQEVAMKQRLWTMRFEFEKLLKETSLALSEMTRYLAIATTDDGYITSSGAVNVLENKEFWDIDVAKEALRITDEFDLYNKIVHSLPQNGDVKTLIGEEIGLEKLENCAIVFAEYSTPRKKGTLGIMGPARMKYNNVIPAVRYSTSLIQELGGSW